jgi:WD40 repeat protein
MHYCFEGCSQGKSLATILAEQGTFSPAEVWQILEDLLPMLQALHERQMIHGDIQPGTIVQANAPCGVYLAARPLLNLESIARTGSQILPGSPPPSPDYAPPEQVRGQPVFASDLYSLGVTCIYLLTSIHPFTLFDAINDRWIWQDYWIVDELENTNCSRLKQVLNQLIESNLERRFTSAKDAIAVLYGIRGLKVPVVPVITPSHWHCTATLSGHQGFSAGVNAVAIAPDHQTIASASQDKTICLWNINTKTLLFTLPEKARINTVAFHPSNAELLASGCHDRAVQLWNLQTRQAKSFIGHRHAVNAVAWSPDGKVLASGSSDKTVKLWNVEGNLIATLEGHRLAVNAIAFSPQGNIILSASADASVCVWDSQTFERLQVLVGHTGAVTAIAFAPNGEWFATGSEDRTIRIWDTSYECIRTLPGHPWLISGLTISPNSKILLSSSWDCTIKLWDVKQGKEIESLVGHTDSITSVAIAQNGGAIVSGSQDKTVKVWRTSENLFGKK